MPRTLAGPRTQAGTRTLGSRSGIKNGNFEIVPTFVAPTTTSNRWIDGTAGGNTTNDNYGWGTVGSTNFSTQFDSSTSNSGTNSLKCSTTGVAGILEVHMFLGSVSAIKTFKYCPTVAPSTKYYVNFSMKTNYVSGDSNDGAYLAVLERGATNTALVTNSSTKVKTTTNWTSYTMTFTTNASTVYLDINMRVYGQTGTGTLIMDAWFDDITLTPAARTLVS